jgi:hypothetical protein
VKGEKILARLADWFVVLLTKPEFFIRIPVLPFFAFDHVSSTFIFHRLVNWIKEIICISILLLRAGPSVSLPGELECKQ